MGVVYTYLKMNNCKREPSEEDAWDNWYPDQSLYPS